MHDDTRTKIQCVCGQTFANKSNFKIHCARKHTKKQPRKIIIVKTNGDYVAETSKLTENGTKSSDNVTDSNQHMANNENENVGEDNFKDNEGNCVPQTSKTMDNGTKSNNRKRAYSAIAKRVPNTPKPTGVYGLRSRKVPRKE